MKTKAVILAAGQGTRMKSDLLKVLHPVAGKAMIMHVVEAARAAGASEIIVVTGYQEEKVRQLPLHDVTFVSQREQRGTGHALSCARHSVGTEDHNLLVLYGDNPLLSHCLLQRMVRTRMQDNADIVILTTILDDPFGYGRVVRSPDGSIVRIVEQRDLEEGEQHISEVLTGVFCFRSPAVFQLLEQLDTNNAQREYLLPDVVEIAIKSGLIVSSVLERDSSVCEGVNDRHQLANAERILRMRKLKELMDLGVTVLDPHHTYVDLDVTVGRDSTLYPGTFLKGKTSIGTDCVIGPGTQITDSILGNRVHVQFSVIEESVLEDDTRVGPYSHIRAGSHICTGAKIGNFAEIKNSRIGPGSKVPHHSYVGDTTLGAGVNVGAGAVTVNYDGKRKHRTVVGDGAFLGCNSNLVAPVTINKDAYVAAGSTISEDVPEAALAIARARQVNKEGWVNKHRQGEEEDVVVRE